MKTYTLNVIYIIDGQNTECIEEYDTFLAANNALDECLKLDNEIIVGYSITDSVDYVLRCGGKWNVE
jgi:hypothetical protein